MAYNNRRIYFPTQLFGFAPMGSTDYIAAHGAQSVGINTNFTLENIQELGQISVYQIVEQVPEIEVTTEKVIDGYPPLYCLATQGAPNGSLAGRSNQRVMFALSIYEDIQSSASGTPLGQATTSGLYFSSVNYTFGTDQAFRESVSLVGNNIQWIDSGFTFTPNFVNDDSPLALAGSGGAQIRRDIIFSPCLGVSDPNRAKETAATLDVNGQLNAFLTILPPDIPGISSSGTNDTLSDGQFSAHITSLACGTQVGRDAILEIGRREPYFRFANFPVEVTTDIGINGQVGTFVNAIENGTDGFGNNLINRTIKIRVREGLFLDLGKKNKLRSVTYGGGDTTGGQVTCNYSYVNFNDFTVTHPQDPSNITWPY